jgi:hypothetical protein
MLISGPLRLTDERAEIFAGGTLPARAHLLVDEEPERRG